MLSVVALILSKMTIDALFNGFSTVYTPYVKWVKNVNELM